MYFQGHHHMLRNVFSRGRWIERRLDDDLRLGNHAPDFIYSDYGGSFSKLRPRGGKK